MTQYYLGLDLSLTRPGFAVISVQDRRAELVECFHLKTPGKLRAHKYEYIEDMFYRWILTSYRIKYDGIIREKFTSRNMDTCASVFGSWASVDRALAKVDALVTAEYTPQQIKKTVAGNGRAEKDQVADAVRIYLGLPSNYSFRSDDESDACAVALTHLLKEGLIDGKI